MSDFKQRVPRLRFPGFTGEWEVKKLGDILTAENSTIAQNKLNLKQEGYPVYGADGLIGYIDTYHSNEGYYIAIVKDGAVGRVSFYQEKSSILGTLAYLKIKNSDTQCLKFCYYLLQKFNFSEHIKGTAIPHIYFRDYSNEYVLIPSLNEQQKIATCLSSIDALINAQTQKIDALKKHKKALLQKLFPKEGETEQKLRFPGFTGEWEVRKIGDIADVAASGDLDKSLYSSEQTESHPFPIYANALENEGLYGFYSISKYPENSVTITARGNLGQAMYRDHKFMGIGRLVVVSNFKNIEPFFFKESWNHLISVVQESTSIPQLTAVAVRSLSLPFPNILEQQKIATCLSTLDELISAERQKHIALKTHKKALLQQLFPQQQ